MSAVALADADLSIALDAGLAEASLPLDARARGLLVAYVALLAKWNRTYNLTAIREPAKMVSHHLLDSLAVLPALDALMTGTPNPRVVDVGSGAGLPGLPIAIARPDWQVVMLEPVHKKTAFLTQAIAELRIDNARATATRVEDFSANPPFTIAISRAFSDLTSFAQVSARLLADNGHLVAMKGVYPDEELRELPSIFTVTATLPLVVPGVEGARHLVVMQRRHEG